MTRQEFESLCQAVGMVAHVEGRGPVYPSVEELRIHLEWMDRELIALRDELECCRALDALLRGEVKRLRGVLARIPRATIDDMLRELRAELEMSVSF